MAKIMNFKVYPNVILGKNAIIEDNVIIGLPLPDSQPPVQTIIGDNGFIRANTIIYAGVTIGNNFQTGPNVLIREENIIGNNVVIWHGSTLNPGNNIGHGSRIHANCFLEQVILEKEVFLGPHAVFTDDPHPTVPTKFRDCFKGARVGRSVVIGANCTILPNISIGHHAFIGAGSVVTKNVPSFKVAVGNPARIIKNTKDIVCRIDGKIHKPYG